MTVLFRAARGPTSFKAIPFSGSPCLPFQAGRIRVPCRCHLGGCSNEHCYQDRLTDQTIATRQPWAACAETTCETSPANPARRCSALLHPPQPSARWHEGQQAPWSPVSPSPSEDQGCKGQSPAPQLPASGAGLPLPFHSSQGCCTAKPFDFPQPRLKFAVQEDLKIETTPFFPSSLFCSSEGESFLTTLHIPADAPACAPGLAL